MQRGRGRGAGSKDLGRGARSPNGPAGRAKNTQQRDEDQPPTSPSTTPRNSMPGASPSPSGVAAASPSPPMQQIQRTPISRTLWTWFHLTGRKVSVQTTDNSIYEGILHTVNLESSDGVGVVLKMVRKTVGPDGQAIPVSGHPQHILVINPEDFLQLQAKDFEDSGSGYATPASAGMSPEPSLSPMHSARGFATDSEISAQFGAGQDRQFQPWCPEEEPGEEHYSLETASHKVGGWDQFETNERLYNVKSTYSEELYTTKLDPSAPDFHHKKRAAEQIASEIEAESTGNVHLAEERGQIQQQEMSEEDKYGAVQRNPSSTASSPGPQKVYVPPHKRTQGSSGQLKGAASPAAPPSPASATLSPATAKKAPSSNPKPASLEPPDSPAIIQASASTKTLSAMQAESSVGKSRSQSLLGNAKPVLPQHIGEPEDEVANLTGQSVSNKHLQKIVAESRPRSQSDPRRDNTVAQQKDVAAPEKQEALRKGPSEAELLDRLSPVVECAITSPGGSQNPLLAERVRLRQTLVQEKFHVQPVAATETTPRTITPSSPLISSPLVDNPKGLQALQLEPCSPNLPPEVVRDFRNFQIARVNDSKSKQKVFDSLKSFQQSLPELVKKVKPDQQNPIVVPEQPKLTVPEKPSQSSVVSPSHTPHKAANSVASAPVGTASPPSSQTAQSVAPSTPMKATPAAPTSASVPSTPSTPLKDGKAATPSSATSSPLASPKTPSTLNPSAAAFNPSAPAFSPKAPAFNPNAATFSPKNAIPKASSPKTPTAPAVPGPPLWPIFSEATTFLDSLFENMSRRLIQGKEVSPSLVHPKWIGTGSYSYKATGEDESSPRNPHLYPQAPQIPPSMVYGRPPPAGFVPRIMVPPYSGFVPPVVGFPPPGTRPVKHGLPPGVIPGNPMLANQPMEFAPVGYSLGGFPASPPYPMLVPMAPMVQPPGPLYPPDQQ